MLVNNVASWDIMAGARTARAQKTWRNLRFHMPLSYYFKKWVKIFRVEAPCSAHLPFQLMAMNVVPRLVLDDA